VLVVWEIKGPSLAISLGEKLRRKCDRLRSIGLLLLPKCCARPGAKLVHLAKVAAIALIRNWSHKSRRLKPTAPYFCDKAIKRPLSTSGPATEGDAWLMSGYGLDRDGRYASAPPVRQMVRAEFENLEWGD
jgi:hypothetical protein